MTRKILTWEKGYPDPAESARPDENGLTVYAQDEYKRNPELVRLLAHASKFADKNAREQLWTERAAAGSPEFTVCSIRDNLAIAIECKPPAKSNNHISPYLRDEDILVKRGDVIGRYAVDGALHYARFLAPKYNVLAIGVSGIYGGDGLRISTYYWEKGEKLLESEKQVRRKVKGQEITETLCYGYGPFVNVRLDALQSYGFYREFLDKESQRIIREFNEQKAVCAAVDLNVMLDGAGVSTTVRAILVSGLLLALRDRTFQKTYEDREISQQALQDNLNTAIARVVNSEDIRDDFKKKVLRDKFNDAFNQQDLLENNAQGLRDVLEMLHKTVYPCMNSEYAVDVIGKFYHEFLSYAPNGQNNGIKLPPPAAGRPVLRAGRPAGGRCDP